MVAIIKCNPQRLQKYDVSNNIYDIEGMPILSHFIVDMLKQKLGKVQ